MAMTQDQFRKLMGLNKPEPLTNAVATGLNYLKQPLDQYALDSRFPLIGGMTAADFTGLTGTQGLVQDFSRGKNIQGDMRMFDALGLVPAIAPAMKLSGKATKALGREVARQIETGTGIIGKNTIDPRQYMFIGEKSQAWNPVKAKQAIKLEKSGASPEEIWGKTGTVRGIDGQLRQEISDVPAKFNTAQDLIEKANQIKLRNEDLKKIVAPIKNQKDLFPKQLTEARRPYKEEIEKNLNLLNKNYGLEMSVYNGNFAPLVVEHPELYKAYPDMERIVINQGINKGDSSFGAYYPSKNLDSDSMSIYKAALNRTAEGNQNWGGKSTALHELQHAIQQREGFSQGGSSDFFVSKMLDEKNNLDSQIDYLNKQMSIIAKKEKMTPVEKDAYDMLMEQRMQLVPRYQQLQDPQFVRSEAFKQYNRLGGEAESRLTQERMDLTPEERLQYFPYNQGKYGLDVPFNELVVNGLL